MHNKYLIDKYSFARNNYLCKKIAAMRLVEADSFSYKFEDYNEKT